MKTLIATVALATVLVAPIFTQAATAAPNDVVRGRQEHRTGSGRERPAADAPRFRQRRLLSGIPVQPFQSGRRSRRPPFQSEGRR